MADEEPIALDPRGTGLEIDDEGVPFLTSHHQCTYGEPITGLSDTGVRANRFYRSNTADCGRFGYSVGDGSATTSRLVYVGNASQVGQVHSRILTAHPDMDRSLFGRTSRSQTIRRRRALSDEQLDFDDDEDGEPELVVQTWRDARPEDTHHEDGPRPRSGPRPWHNRARSDDDDAGDDDDDDTIMFSADNFGQLPQIIDDKTVISVLCRGHARGLPGEVINRIEWYRDKCVENGWGLEERMLSAVLAEAKGTKKSCP